MRPFVHHELAQHGQYSQPQQYQAPAAPAYPTQYAAAGQYPGRHARPHHARAHVASNQCQLDYVDSGAEVCVPTFTTQCDKEEVAGGVVIKHYDQCHDVVRTVCTETQDIEDMEVCAWSVASLNVEAEAKLVEAVWEETCHDVEECVPAPPRHGYHAPACNKVIR